MPGKIRARCKEDACVLELPRSSPETISKVAADLKAAGLRPVSTSTDPDGPSDYASEIRFQSKSSGK